MLLAPVLHSEPSVPGNQWHQTSPPSQWSAGTELQECTHSVCPARIAALSRYFCSARCVAGNRSRRKPQGEACAACGGAVYWFCSLRFMLAVKVIAKSVAQPGRQLAVSPPPPAAGRPAGCPSLNCANLPTFEFAASASRGAVAFCAAGDAPRLLQDSDVTIAQVKAFLH